MGTELARFEASDCLAPVISTEVLPSHVIDPVRSGISVIGVNELAQHPRRARHLNPTR